MGVELKKSHLSERVVNKVIDGRLRAYRDLTGKNPSSEQRDKMKSEIIGLAKKIDQTGRG